MVEMVHFVDLDQGAQGRTVLRIFKALTSVSFGGVPM